MRICWNGEISVSRVLGPGMDRHAWIDEQFAAVPLFAGMSKKQLRRISSLMTRLDRPAGQVLTTEGQQGHEFFIVLEGEVEVRRAVASGAG